MQKTIYLSGMLLSLLLFTGCHHIHCAYGIPTYMQPKGFSMTYKESLYSTPVGIDCPPTYLQEDSELSNNENSHQSFDNDSAKINTIYDAQKVKELMEGDTIASPLPPKGLPLTADVIPPVRIGQRKMSPVKSSRGNSRF